MVRRQLGWLRLLGLALIFALGVVVGIAVDLIARFEPHLRATDFWAFLRDNKDQLGSIGALATGIGALLAAGGLIAAAATAWAALRQTQVAEQARKDERFEKVESQWKKLAPLREKAWAALDPRSVKRVPEVDYSPVNSLLNFYESIAYDANRGALDDVRLWNFFYAEFTELWSRGRSFIAAQREMDPAVWTEFEVMLMRLKAIEAVRQGQSIAG